MKTLITLFLTVFPVAYASAECSVKHDEFIDRDEVSVIQNTGSLDGLFALLLAKVTEKQITAFSVQAIFSFDSWHFLGERAVADDQREFVVKSNRRTMRRRVSETVLIQMPDIDYLRSKSDTGFKIKVYGKRGDEILDIPAPLLQEFLACVDAY